jgi:hypothetical protein
MDLIKTTASNHKVFGLAVLWGKLMKPQSSASIVYKNINDCFVAVPEQNSYVSAMRCELMILCSY